MSGNMSVKRSSTEAFDTNEFVTEESHAEKLPQQVLVEILKQLSAFDLRSASLVCRSWYHACNEKEVRLSKKQVMYTEYGITEIINMLKQCNWKYQYLDFRGLKFDEYEHNYWEECGHKINRLKFYDCWISPRTMMLIIKHCTDLEYLSLAFSGCTGPRRTPFSPNVLKYLESNRNALKKLQLLEIVLHEPTSIQKDTVLKLSEAFPQVNLFGITYPGPCHSLTDLGIPKPLLSSCEIFSYASNCIPSGSHSLRLDEIGLVFKEEKFTSEMSTISTDFLCKHTNLRVCRVIIEPRIYSHSDPFSLSLFSEMPEIYSHSVPFTLSLFPEILTRCVNLLYIKVEQANASFYLSKDGIEFLAASKLIKLSIKARDLFPFTVSPWHQNFVQNHTLRSLSLDFASINVLQIEFFLKCFPGVIQLSLNACNDEILHKIWKYMSNLRSLKILDCTECTSRGFSGRSTKFSTDTSELSNSIGRLQQLEYLHLNAEHGCKWKLEDIVKELDSPKLKYIKMKNKSDSCDLSMALFKLARKCPMLECVGIYSRGTPFEAYEIFCSRLKRLRILQLDHKSHAQHSEEEIKILFDRCPSLLYVICEGIENSFRKFHYDASRQKLSCIQTKGAKALILAWPKLKFWTIPKK